jgi:hypothetical protein
MQSPRSPSERTHVSAVLMEPILGAAGWRPDEFLKEKKYVYVLSGSEIDEIRAAVDRLESLGLDIKEIDKSNFGLPRFSSVLMM